MQAHDHIHGNNPLVTSAQATLHCLTGCVIGEVAGLLIGVSLGLSVGPIQQIVDYFGAGSQWGATISWSHEPEPLEAAGGIINALPRLGSAPFMLVNGDVWTDYPFASLAQRSPDSEQGAHLVLVDNPPQHPRGDFVLFADGHLGLIREAGIGLTYAGLGIYTPGFFDGVAPGKSALKPLLDRAIEQHRLTGEHYTGQWVDVGTPERLAALDAELSAVNRDK